MSFRASPFKSLLICLVVLKMSTAVEMKTRRHVVLSTYREMPSQLLGRLSECIGSDDLLFVYHHTGKYRDHNNHGKIDSTVTVDDWRQTAEAIGVDARVYELYNEWSSGDEASAYLLHIALNYEALSDRTVFLHGHIASWHSEDICSLITRGFSANDNFVELNLPYPHRCVSDRGCTGPYVNEDVRATLMGKWASVVGTPTPERLTWSCCAQFAATSATIRRRPQTTWWKLYLHSMFDQHIQWEYMWDTLVDQDRAVAAGTC